MTVTDWLLDSDPAIRWQVMRDLTDEPADVAAAERARVAREGWGARLLELQPPNGVWGGGGNFPKRGSWRGVGRCRDGRSGRKQPMTSAPIILVPGFWLGAWAWDEVAEKLRADGHDVTTITLPGQASQDEDRSSITFGDHVDAIIGAVEAADRPPVLVVHSASGFSGYAASDRIPDKIAAIVYVDTAPGKPPMDATQEGDKPMVWEEIAAGENLDGLSDEQKATFQERAVPVPGGVLRGEYDFTNDARRDIPSTVIATGYSAADYQTYASENPDWAFLAGLPELRNVTWIDLPTSHWPMWSKPDDIARIIDEVASTAFKGGPPPA